ncbi:hypothetical protein FUA48_10765 [Flavobacterium alkalisoli]|uniref:Uncharacterized protein n=1 Tax=Flavobacterium alkalisoli TaxID=2602769 RepID=A0A5B9FSX4_9FLAO|nr:hypothetical protein [Flavobacterium alkalisoli]QEE50045.1 hypothetical protein FUA48_10765 [Flavobacterium alkalisoli]
MKHIALLLLLFISLTCYSQSFTFKHMGDQDKPMPSIEISVTPKDGTKKNIEKELSKSMEFYYTYYVDTKTFAMISLYITDYKVNREDIFSAELPYGTYNVSYTSPDTKHYNSLYLLGALKSKPFFTGLLPYLKDYKELDEAVNQVIKRLSVTKS